MKKLSLSGIIWSFLFFCMACDHDPSSSPEGPKGELPRELTASEIKLVEADHAFSYDIFRRTVAYDTEKDNLMISPLSISTALAMTLNGANGETYESIRQTLRLQGMSQEEINEAFRSLIKLLISADPKVRIQIANSIWYREGIPVKEGFIQRLKEHYGAEVGELDFSDPASVTIINNWVEQNTEGLIKTIIEKIPGDMAMYLINALYFKGEWLYKFDKKDTRKADFFPESGEQIQVDMMSREGKFATYSGEDARLIELPYGDSLYTMSILMPGDPKMPIDRFISEEVTKTNLDAWRSNLHVIGNTQLKLPKFELKYELTYNNILKAMGMDIAFEEGMADFTGIATTPPLFIDNVKHKTHIRVDEEGTEAAAVTSVGIGITSAPLPISVNRPFVFIVYEQTSGTNLFMGKVKRP
ncbi:serpin family protein [Sinomicrobium kalidii]|uniref:serpin family protein n=1 Tax=Sinomicrobium kalidii TaxID=2900738 RepID=UPI001E32BBC3|nr:serpin family protein [Sinomicrobium kalidii]UGU17550.1 serpin family protein [Sinomicrobium kalidii]